MNYSNKAENLMDDFRNRNPDIKLFFRFIFTFINQMKLKMILFTCFILYTISDI